MTSTIDGAAEPAQVLPHGAALAGELLAGVPDDQAGQSAGDGSAGDGSAGDGSAGDGGQPPRFLEGKLQIPQPHFPVLRRRRVTALLDQAARHRVTLISGPAGAGKTVACATWASAPTQSRRVAWLTVDAEDQQSWFWAYLCAALARLRAIPADVLRSLEDTSPDRFPLRLVEAAQLFTEPVVLILDDVHELADPAVLSGLDLIIRHAPGTLRLVLSVRQSPALQLARLRVSGELADIGGPDLACTADEADAYFAMLGIDVDQGARDELLRRTQGWMAGLRLAAMRARSAPKPGAKITDLVGDEPIVTDYLWDEVLGKQPPQTRTFLLRTSITGEVSGDLADALTGQGGSARTLERLSRENSFVEVVDRERGGYAYHPLLREVLTAELHREIPHEIPVLLRRAARWYAAHDQPLRSVRCAAQAEDWDYAAQILAESGAGVATPGCTAELESVLALFPPDRSADDPAVATAWAAARLWDGDHEGAAAYLDNGDQALRRAMPAMRRVMEPTLAALRVMLAGCRCDPEPGLLAEAGALAGRCEAAASAQPEHRAAGLLWFAVGVARLRRWEIQAARHALRHADRQLAAGNLAGLQARARAWRALAEAWCGDLTAAQRSAGDVPATRGLDGLAPAAAGQAAELAALARAQISLRRDDLSTAQRLIEGISQGTAGQFPGEPPVGAMAALIRARVLLADGDASATVAVLSRLRETYGPAHLALSDVITVAEGDAALRVGNTGRARAVLLLVADGENFDQAGGRLLRAGLLVADGEFKAALEAVQPCLDGAAGVTQHEQISGLLLAAVAHRRLGGADEAAALLEQALALAEPDGAYRAFLDGGPAVRSAMTVLIPPTSRHAGFAGRVLERFDAQVPQGAAAAARASVPLTDSERAVLRFLPSHMTNEEISQALFLSINTVKTHLRSAYRKLGVSSRREAIARGRRLGLLLRLLSRSPRRSPRPRSVLVRGRDRVGDGDLRSQRGRVRGGQRRPGRLADIAVVRPHLDRSRDQQRIQRRPHAVQRPLARGGGRAGRAGRAGWAGRAGRAGCAGWAGRGGQPERAVGGPAPLGPARHRGPAGLPVRPGLGRGHVVRVAHRGIASQAAVHVFLDPRQVTDQSLHGQATQRWPPRRRPPGQAARDRPAARTAGAGAAAARPGAVRCAPDPRRGAGRAE